MEYRKREKTHGRTRRTSEYERMRWEGQSPLGTEPGKGYQVQQEGFLQVHEQQKEDWKNMRPLLNQMCVLLMEDTDKAELLNAFFSSVLLLVSVFKDLRPLEEKKTGERKTYPWL